MLLHLRGWKGELPDEGDHSVLDQLELAMGIAEKAAEQYVELAAGPKVAKLWTQNWLS